MEIASDEKPICPYCRQTDRQVKAGLHGQSQRYKCGRCGRRYLMDRTREISGDEVRERALALNRQGLSAQDIAARLEVNPRNVSNWIRKARPRSKPARDEAEKAQPRPAPPHPAPDAADSRRRATVVEVAKLAGVSISTVSNYLTNKGRMSAETRERIRRAASELKFTPNSLVRAIRSRRTNIVGVVTINVGAMHEAVGDNPSAALIAGIAATAADVQNNILLYTRWTRPVEELAEQEYLDGHIDGLIWISPLMEHPQVKHVVDAGLPTVTMLASRGPEGSGSIAVDNLAGMQALVDHLASLGHRRIAYIGPSNAWDFIERIEGYKIGLAKNGIEFDPELLAADERVNDSWVFSNAFAYTDRLNRWVHMARRPTAIMASNDQWALWIYRYLTAHDFRIPEDFAVTGFDDSAAASIRGASITTVKQDFYQIAVLGAQLLFKLIGGAPAEECHAIYPCQLVVRESTAGKATSR
jgi:LacI family transcriptional regulator